MKILKPTLIKKIKTYSLAQKLFLLVPLFILVASLIILFSSILINSFNSNGQISPQEIADVADTAIANANDKVAGGDYAAAAGILESYIASTNSQEQKYEAYLELGRLWLENDQSDKSSEAYKNAEKINQVAAYRDIRFLLGISYSAEARGENREAIKYYKLALGLLNSQKDPEQQELKSDIEKSISTLEGGSDEG